MSLYNLIADKSSQAALTNNRTLPKFTTTTYAEAGTSLGKIAEDSFQSAKSAISAVGGSDENFNKPIKDMFEAAVKADPSNTDSYVKAAQNSLSGITSSAESAIGSSSSLYDIQTRSREAVSGAVNNFGASIEAINPAISSSVLDTGMTSLSETGRLIDKSCTAAYNGAFNSVNKSVSDVHNTIASKIEAENLSNSLNPGEELVEIPSGSDADVIAGAVEDAKEAETNLVYTTKDIDESTEGQRVHEGLNTTDVIYQDVKVYVEGVQVPFEAVSINQAIGQLPSATFQIPPQSGLMDIARYYQPKVHIFYTDANTGGDRLLFWGHIVACNYARSQSRASANISFECIHKNALIQQLTFEWSAGGAGNPINGGSQTDINPNQASVQLNNFNSERTLIEALHGIVGIAKDKKDFIDPSNKDLADADPVKLQQRFEIFEKRLIGMPSSVMNLWNQVKKEIYSNEKLNVIFSKIYVPLIEDGLRFFDRVSGHFHLEKQIHETRVEHCNDHARPELTKYKTMLPPSYRMDIMSAVQTKMAISSLKGSLGFSGEMTSFLDLFMNFYYAIEYEMITLASPAEVPLDPESVIDPDDLPSWRSQERTAVETIIKPQIPFYFSPICNVLLPNMFHSITVQQNESDIPTRITAIGTAPAQATNQPHLVGLNYRAPHSIREAIAVGRKTLNIATEDRGDSPITLKETTGSSFNLPGKYELGRGIKHKKLAMPDWLSHFSKEEDSKRDAKSDEKLPEADTLQYKNLLNLHLAWVDKYGYNYVYDDKEKATKRVRDKTKDSLNPYSTNADIMAYERLLFSSAEYEYTKDVVRSKSGNVECLFNPYIIPGYPMDIIDASPNHPSFHAMCASVNHTFTSRSISTNVSFVAAMTYTEMSNYQLHHTHPWLQNALSMINIQRSETLTEDGETESAESDLSASKPKPEVEVVTPLDTSKGYSDARFMREEEERRLAKDNKKHELSTAYGLPANPEYDQNTGDIKAGGIQQGLINNPRAKLAADNFYRSVLGIGAADPGLIFDFNQGGPSAVKRRYGTWIADSSEKRPQPNGGEGNDNLTGVGNLRLVSRPIEGRRSIENKFDIKFIDLIPQNYTGTPLFFEHSIATNSQLLEPGASMFLDYEDIDNFINRSNISTKGN